MTKFKPYKPLFEQGKSKKDTKRILEKSLRELYRIKKSINKLKEEDELEPSAVEDAIDQVEEVITDIIDEIGVTSPAVDTLVDAAKELEMQSDEEEFDFEDEDEFMEAEEDDEEEEDEDSDDDEDEKEDDEKKESIKRKKR
jgi:protein DEK